MGGRGRARREGDVAELEISVLGPVRARRDGVDLALGGPRPRAVLARLAVAEGRVVDRERLIDEVWDGAPPASATNTLQSYVSNLRRALGGDGAPVVARIGDGYALEVDEDVLTAVRFEARLRAAQSPGRDAAGRLALLDPALALWHGPALGDLADEPWARGPAVRLGELRLVALEARFAALLDLGRHGVVVGDLEVAVAAHPLRERLTELLVLALYRAGRQADALRAHERTRAHLADELGLEPSPELVALAGRVLAHDPALAVPGAEAPSPIPPRSEAVLADPVPRAPAGPGSLPLPGAVAERRARSAFVGRDAEAAALHEEWQAVVAGARRITSVAGEPGVGKTRLVQHLARRVHAEGAVVLWGRCSVEALIAHQPVVEALRTATSSLGEAERADLVGRHPTLAHLVPDLGPVGTASHPADRFALYEDLADLTTEVSAAAPVLLVLDDLQWADASTLTLLAHVLAHLGGGRLLVAATVRRPAGRPTTELDAFLADQRRAGRHRDLELAGLATPAVAALLDACGTTVDEAVAARVRDRTGGNPFFVEALAERGEVEDEDDRQVPASVRDVLDQRLAALPADALAVLVAAAVIGLRVDLELLAAVAGRDVDDLLDLVDAAVADGLLVEDEVVGRVTFPHALVRQALVARTSRNREARLHREVATALAAGPPGPDVVPARAEHLLAAGRTVPVREAAAAALAAAGQALDGLADAAAHTWAERVLGVLDREPGAAPDLRAEALVVSATALRRLGRLPAARGLAAEAVAVARAGGAVVALAAAAQETALQEAGVGLSYGAVDDGLISLLDEARALLPPDRVAERSALLAWSSIARDGTDPALQPELAGEARDLAATLPGRPHLRALATFARRIAVAGPDGLAERLRLGPEMDQNSRGWPELEVISHVMDVTGLLEADRVPEAEAAHERLREVVAGHRRPASTAYLLFLDATMALARGDLDAGAALSDRALEAGGEAHGANALQMWAAQQITLARDRGEVAALVPMVEERVDQFPRLQVWRAVLALGRASAGDLAGARDAYRPLFVEGRWASRHQTSLWYVTTLQVAEAAWLAADPEASTILAAALVDVADRLAVTGMGSACMGPLAFGLGVARATAGDLDGAVAALDRAEARAAAGGFGPAQVRSLLARAVVRERRGAEGDAEAAADDRERGGALATALGVAPVVPAS